jgi:hypothetical protein
MLRLGNLKRPFYQEMRQEGMTPDRFAFVPLLDGCASLRALEEGGQVHDQIIQTACEADVFVGTSLVDMYAKCGSMEDTQRVFNNMPSHTVVCRNAMLLGHVKCAQGQKALKLLQPMQHKGVWLDCGTFVGVLNTGFFAVIMWI